MRILLPVLQSHRTFSPTATVALRLVTTCAVFASMLWLGARAYFSGAHASEQPPEQNLSPEVQEAWWNGAGSGQFEISGGDMKINIEAFNKKREKDIANDSRKLLSLAIALKFDLEQHPGFRPSDDPVETAKKIEKLAHDVKEYMKLDIVGVR